MQQFPIFLNLTGQPVLIVGDGEAAAAKGRLVARAGGRIVASLAEGPRLAFVALDDAEDAAAVAAELRSAGLLVNVVDRPSLCDFTTPAIIDRAPVTVAIGSAGASAGLAKALRQRIEAVIPARLGALAAALADARDAARARWPDKDDRRRAIDAGLAPGAALDPFGAGGERGAAAVADWLGADLLGAAGGAAAPVRVETVKLASGDPDDLTLRQARWLAGADWVVHAADVPPAILARARADAVRRVGDGVTADMAGLVVILRS